MERNPHSSPALHPQVLSLQPGDLEQDSPLSDLFLFCKTEVTLGSMSMEFCENGANFYIQRA